MLVLTRKQSQKILVGDNVTITVTRIGTNQVRIGIDAPSDILIRRGELIEQWTETESHAGV